MVSIMYTSQNNPDDNDQRIKMVVDDQDENSMSSLNSIYDDHSFMEHDAVTSQLAAAGPTGVAAAAAIMSSSKKYKRPFSFETNPSIRKRQQNRLIRKLKKTIDEYSIRVGQQAIVLIAAPGNKNYKVLGAHPLKIVIENLKAMIMEELENALAHQAPPPIAEDPSLFELPPLIIDGIPTPVEKMTQAQLRAFIPLMLKYSTGRGKPGWGRESTRPPWWPRQLPWANVRMDARSEEEKQSVSWTHALRQIVINCYKFHGREDLLPADNLLPENVVESIIVEKEKSNQCKTTTTLLLEANGNGNNLEEVSVNHPIITLPDGTKAQIQGIATVQEKQDDNTSGYTFQTIVENGGSQNNIGEGSSSTEIAISTEGQYILTDSGQTIPIGGILYGPISNLPHIFTTDNSTTPMVIVPKMENSDGDENSKNLDALRMTSSDLRPQYLTIQTEGEEGSQIVQIVSIRDLPKSMQGLVDCKSEPIIVYGD